MYLWNTKALKRDLKANAVSQQQQMLTYVLFGCFVGIMSDFHRYTPPDYRYGTVLVIIARALISAAGIYVVYLANRAGDDRDFLGRFICLGLPTTLKVYLATYALIIAAAVALHAVGKQHGFLFDLVTQFAPPIVLFAILRHHMKDVSGANTSSAGKCPPPLPSQSL